MRRMIVLAVAATLTLSACGTGTGTGDGGDPDVGGPPSASATPTAEALPTPTPTLTLLPEVPEEGAPAPDLEPVRVTAGEAFLSVWNAGGEFIDVIYYNIKPKDAVAKFTTLFGVTPTRIAHPAVAAGSAPDPEWQAGDFELDGWDFHGFQVFPRDQIYDLRAWEIRAVSAWVNGIEIEFADGTQVGQAISTVTNDLGDPWPSGEQYFWGMFPSTRGYIFFTESGGSTVAGWIVPYGA